MRFTKMHGAGNDYVYVDCFAEPMPKTCRSWRGGSPIGASASAVTGLILICPSRAGRCRDADVQRRRVSRGDVRQRHSLRREVSFTTMASAAQEKLRIESAGRVLSLNLTRDRRQGRASPCGHGRADLASGARFRRHFARPPGRGRPSSTFPSPSAAANSASLASRWETRIALCSWTNPRTTGCSASGRKLEVDPHFPNRVNVEFRPGP